MDFMGIEDAKTFYKNCILRKFQGNFKEMRKKLSTGKFQGNF